MVSNLCILWGKFYIDPAAVNMVKGDFILWKYNQPDVPPCVIVSFIFNLQGLAHHLVLVTVVKKSKLFWCINSRLIVCDCQYRLSQAKVFQQ